MAALPPETYGWNDEPPCSGCVMLLAAMVLIVGLFYVLMKLVGTI